MKASFPPAARNRPAVVLVAAVAANQVIGAGNGLPWRLSEDLRRFRALTTGHAVIMGRKTWESLPHALADRQNIVVTRTRGYVAPGAEVAHSLAEALAKVTAPQPAYCIGGGELYREALPYASELRLTEIDRCFDGDTLFPARDPREWRETARETHAAGPEGFGYAYVTYARVVPARD
jgi:dihydrofolate reductase